jgi:hypothetical protein
MVILLKLYAVFGRKPLSQQTSEGRNGSAYTDQAVAGREQDFEANFSIRCQTVWDFVVS